MTKIPSHFERHDTRSGRFYEIDGESYPSVTTLLEIIAKPALLGWISKVEREMVIKVAGELYQDCPVDKKMSAAAWQVTLNNRLGTAKASAKELAKAGEIGSQVHALIEWSLKAELLHDAGPSPRISDQAQWAYMAWQNWRRRVHLKPLYVEQVVYSSEYGYAGTLDLVAEVNGVLTVLDWKTGKGVYNEAHLQNAAYRQAWREMKQGDPKQGLIVRLPKNVEDPEFEVEVEVVEAKPEEEMFPRFLDAARLWMWQNEMNLEREKKKASLEKEA